MKKRRWVINLIGRHERPFKVKDLGGMCWDVLDGMSWWLDWVLKGTREGFQRELGGFSMWLGWVIDVC